MDVQNFNTFYVNFNSALLLFVLLVIIYIKKDIYDFSGRIFKYMIILTMVLLLLESSTLYIDGIDNVILRKMNFSINFIIFLLTPLFGYLWALYLDHKIFKTRDRKKHYYFYLLPFIIGSMLSVINLFTPVLFSISEENVYSREPMIMMNFAMLFMLLIYITYLAILNRKNIDRKILSGAVLFLMFPAIGGTFQMMFYGVSTIFSAFAIAIFSTYIALETIGTSKDNLTGLFTRTKASEYMNELIHKQYNFGVIMIDLDSFKQLNDTLGHNEGDKVLIAFGDILMNIFNKDAIVSRFGGDEFIIVKKNFDTKDLGFYQRAIYREFSNKDVIDIFSENFKFSIGCSVFKEDSLKSGEELVIEADNNMYLNKAENKNYRRRISD